jgi:hypothetical protein
MKAIRIFIFSIILVVVYLMSGLFLVGLLDSACKISHLCEGGHEDVGIFAILSLLLAVIPTWFCFMQMWEFEKQKTKAQLGRIARLRRITERQMKSVAQQPDKRTK